MSTAQELQVLASTDPGAAVAQLRQFSYLLTSDELDTRVAAADGLASLARHEEYRSEIGKSGIIGELVGILKTMKASWNEELCTNALRALGNLCFDQDDNREKVIDSSGATHIAEVLNHIVSVLGEPQNPDSKLHLAASGAVVNMCNGNESVQHQFAEKNIPQSIVQLFCRSKMNHGRMMALQAMSALDENDTMLDTVCASEEAVDTLMYSVQQTVSEHGEALAATDGAETADIDDSAQAPSMPTKSVAMEACEQELHLLRQCVNKCTELSGFRSARVLSALISLCSRCGANNIVPSTSGRQATARLASSSCAPPRDISASAALILSCVMGDDECQRQAIEIQSTHSGGDGLKVLVQWFASWMAGEIGSRPHDWDVPSAGAVALGNMARSADMARYVQQCDGVVASLLSMVSSDKISLQFAALNTLKNLSVLESNRPLLLAQGITTHLAVALDSPQGALQYMTAGILRTLCTCADAAEALGDMEGLVPRLVHLGKQEEEGVRMEATRVVCNLIRFTPKPSPQLLSELYTAVPNLVMIVQSQHDKLKSEGLVALVRLCTGGGRTHVLASDAPATAIKVITEYATNAASRPDEIICNALSFLASLLVPPEDSTGQLLLDTRRVLVLLKQMPSPSTQVQAHAQTIASVLTDHTPGH